MSTADATIEALRAGDDELRPVVEGLTDEQLTGPSAASEWDVSQVVSHLGSGAVITLAGLEAALDGRPNPGMDANRAVWARWDAMGAQERRTEFLAANTALLERYEGLDDDVRSSLRVDLGFLPEPVDLATAAGMRLNEFALHSWDVRVALDEGAVVHPDAVPLLVDQAGMRLGWIAKPAAVLAGRTADVAVRLTDPERAFGLSLSESASLGEVPQQPDTTLEAPAEAWLRLITGRLAPRWTPASVHVDGALTLDELRAVFPGY